MSRIRPKAVCVFLRNDRILVGSGVDRVRGDTFYGPPGGGIEFGEYAVAAAQREMAEEIGTDIADPILIGVLENVFEYNGATGHDILFVFATRFLDKSMYECPVINGNENGKPMPLSWEALDSFGPGRRRLIPDGLLELLGTMDLQVWNSGT